MCLVLACPLAHCDDCFASQAMQVSSASVWRSVGPVLVFVRVHVAHAFRFSVLPLLPTITAFAADRTVKDLVSNLNLSTFLDSTFARAETGRDMAGSSTASAANVLKRSAPAS